MNKNYQKTLSQLETRTRFLILIVLIGLIFLLWYFFPFRHLAQQNFMKSNQTLIEKQKILTAQMQIKYLNLEQNRLENTLESLKKEVAIKKLGTKWVNLPKNAMTVLKQLLLKEHRLTLLNLQSKPTSKNQLASLGNRFKHLIEVHFEGDYFSTLNYLEAIESKHWYLFWDRLHYKVTQYPKAEVIVTLLVPSAEDSLTHE
ncbi:MAG: hypothetical protein JW855_01795 [Gammaproteobacteria bacterium]|nr:hypothetical protein [Gammaproteobacteria bacterium]